MTTRSHTHTAPVAVHATNIAYENNPFLVTIHGVKELFTKAQAITITLIVLAALALLGNIGRVIVNVANQLNSSESDYSTSMSIDSSSTDPLPSFGTMVAQINPMGWAMIGIVILIVLIVWLIALLIGTYVKSILDYTASRIALGETVSFGQALSGGLNQLFPYLWVQIIVGFKVFLWSLLFIVPGFIMAVRYSLAGVSFYASGKRGNAAVKDSIELTRGAWLTTFGSYYGLDLLTGGIASVLLQTGSKVVLYRQFSAYRAASKTKPAAHVLSWLALILPIVFVVLALLLIALAIAFAVSLGNSARM